MKMTNGKAMEHMNGLYMVMELTAKDKFPRSVSMKIAKNLRKLKEETKEFIEQQNELMEKYGKSDGNGNLSLARSSETEIKEYMEEIKPLREMEIEVDIVTVNESELPEDMAPAVCDALLFMLEV